MAEWTEADRTKTLRALRSRSAVARSEAVERLCLMFEPLVKSQVRSHRFTVGSSWEDLEQEARVGVVEACTSFVAMAKKKKWNDGAFPMYVVWCVRNALSKYVESIAHPVKLPAWMIRRLPKLRKTSARLAQQLGHEPSADEIADDMKLPIHAIETMLAYETEPYELPSNVSGYEGDGA